MENGRAGVGHVVLADEQTAGRGRFGRAWASPLRGLYATFLVEADPLISLHAGLASVRALADAGASARLKWPNDLWAGERKLGGILVETADDMALVGIGINLESIPVNGAISLRALGVEARRAAVVLTIWSALRQRVDPDTLLQEYRAHCATLNQRVRLLLGSETAVEGIAVDVDDHGRLLVETPEGLRSFSSGECLHVGPFDTT
jgi:BirA family biotin operon repressor/biotin-[acetyl-CoA-carboxylase] ligase